MRRSFHQPSLNRFRPQLISNPALHPRHQLSIRPIFTRPVRTHTPLSTRLVNFAKLSGLFLAIVGSSIYLSDTRAGLHSWLGVPLIKAIASQDPEESHKLAIRLLKFIGAHHLIKDKGVDGDQLAVELWGKRFSNPIGIAAGFDKHADAIDGLFDIGFGYVEVGSVTPEPQAGNPKPRMFRLPSTNSVINRYGFNSEGHLAILTKLRNRVLEYIQQHRYLNPNLALENQIETDSTLDDHLSALVNELELPCSLSPGRVLGVNLGKNKWSAPETIDDFTLGIHRLGPLADVLVINVSSPNTPGLRGLQSKALFCELLTEIVRARDSLKNRPALLVKVAPDLSYSELVDIGTSAREAQIDGIIVSNTTVARPPQAGTDPCVNESGGLSGPPLKPLALRALSTIYSATSGTIPLIGCGGITSGQDALEYAEAGASLVQLYTSLTYEGIGLPRRVKDELKTLLGNKRWQEVVGSRAKQVDAVDAGVEEAKEQLAFIEQKLEAYIDRQRAPPSPPSPPTSSSTTSTIVPAPRPKPSASGLLPDTTSSISTPSTPSVPKAESAQVTPVDELGILAGWKSKRRREIESGDTKRVV
ncbi:hypothetical protein CROQUDRAFT_81302 [Cronartium quercuum f. sp. fusiforme G11]|uniref:Dihydroorotate dehydrogenase (quinone), mitochondrial n=1 Tax=Cronartium quercuum f. sp. fusiforme G11 TaxID=708437 RepID=A0A9P6NFW4_9BASI|nr:hypothetical protein CROQUDRAFT_81302 [Cronartium quercuum f. sp. fusiforme G11]